MGIFRGGSLVKSQCYAELNFLRGLLVCQWELRKTEQGGGGVAMGVYMEGDPSRLVKARVMDGTRLQTSRERPD